MRTLTELDSFRSFSFSGFTPRKYSDDGPPHAASSTSAEDSTAFLIGLSSCFISRILSSQRRRGRRRDGRPGRRVPLLDRGRLFLLVGIVQRQVSLADVGVDELVEQLAVLREDLVEDVGVPLPRPLLRAGKHAAPALLLRLMLDRLRVEALEDRGERLL